MRHPWKDSPNMGWRDPSFQGFADYLQTPESEEHLLALIDLAKQEQLCLMCVEILPWRCYHRHLIADVLTVRGIKVQHIVKHHLQEHQRTPFARVEGTRITYPRLKVALPKET